MDTKDKNLEATSSRPEELMMPDSSMATLNIEEAADAEALQTVEPAEPELVTPEGKPKKSPTPLQESLRRLRKDKRAMASIIVILLFIIIPLIGPVIYQHIGPIYNSPLNGNIGPTKYHNPFW